MKQNIATIKYVFLKNKPEEINDGKRKPYNSSYRKELVKNNEYVLLNELE